jgi:hypothetical protein
MQNDERDRLTPDDARFVEQLRTRYAPPELTPVQRAAFDARLRERLEPRWRGAWLPGLAAASLAALAVWFLPAAPDRPSEPVTVARIEPAPTTVPVAAREEAARVTRSTRDASWEPVLFDYGDTSDATQGVQAELPPELAAIDGLFFDDV